MSSFVQPFCSKNPSANRRIIGDTDGTRVVQLPKQNSYQKITNATEQVYSNSKTFIFNN